MFRNFYKGKKVFVTGHTGFKGAWLVHWLKDLGAEVFGYSVDIPTDPSLFEVCNLKNQIHHQVGNILDLKALKKSLKEAKPDVCFHLAAQALVRPSYDDPLLTYQTNILGTAHVLEALREVPSVKVFVNITSDKCYENDERQEGYTETDPMGGHDPYSASKGCAELIFSSMYRSFYKGKIGISMASARAGNVIGGGDWAKDRILPDAIRAWISKKALQIRSPNAVRPWQHVLECLSGYLWLAVMLSEKAHELSGEGFNFGPDIRTHQPVQKLIETFKQTWGEGKVDYDLMEGTSKKEAHFLMLNCEKSEKKLGWSANLAFEESVELAASWYKQYYENPKNMNKFTSDQIKKYENMAIERKRVWTA